MSIPFSIQCVGIFSLLCGVSIGHAQVEDAISSSATLQAHYAQAHTYLTTGDTVHATEQYRLFLADTLRELATGLARAGQYKQADPYFEEALALVPHSAAIELEFANTAIQANDLDHAKQLIEAAGKETSENQEQQAKTHLLMGRLLRKQNQNDKARPELEKAVALNPTFENGYELAVTCLNLEDKNCAAKIFAEMSHSFGDSAELHLYAGRAYENSDFQTDAVKEFQRAIALNPRLQGAHYSLAAADLAVEDNSKLPTAIEELRTEIRLFPREAIAYAALGHLEANQQKLVEARKDLERAAALDTTNPDIFLYLGQLYADLKKDTEAETALRKSIALTIDPSRNRYQIQKAHYLLGHLLLQSGNKEEGRKELDAAKALMNASLARDHEKLSDYLEDSPGMGATSSMQSAVASVSGAITDPRALHQAIRFKDQIASAVADSYNNLGAIAAGSNDLQAALHCFEQAADWNPTMDGLDLNLGRAAYASGAYLEAIPPLTRYIQSHPTDKEMRSALGLSLFITRNYPETIATLKPIEGDTSLAPQVAFAYADSLVEIGQIQGGMARLEALKERSPNAAAIHRALGKAFALDKNPASAEQEFETAIRLNPDSAESYDALGRLQLDQGETGAAINSLEHAVRLASHISAYHHDLAMAYIKASRPSDAARENQQSHQLEQRPAIP